MGKGVKQKKNAGKTIPAQEEPVRYGGFLLPDRNYLILAGLFILGLFLRLFELSRKSLWLDEASTYFLTTQPDLMAVISAAARDHHAPLHFMTIWVVRIFGSSEFLLRLPSAIAGALTVIVIFCIAKELYNEHAGLIAAALLAVSPYHLQYSQEARMYGMAVFFVSLAVLMFLWAVRTGKLRDWLLFGGACALAFYTHFYTAFAIVALAAGYFIIRFPEFRKKKDPDGKGASPVPLPHDFYRFVMGMALSFILVIPILASFLNQSGYFVAGTFNWGLSMWSIPSQTFLMFSMYLEIVAVLFVGLMLAGFFMMWKKRREYAVALAVILFLPILISMYLSQIIPFNVRYHLYLIVVFLSLVAIPLAWLSEKIHPKYGTGAVIVVVLLVSFIPLSAYYTDASYQDWKTTAVTLDGLTEPGDAIVPLPWTNYLPLSYYYNNQTDGTHYRNFVLSDSGYHELDNEKENVFFVITLSDLNAQGDTAFSESMNYLNNNTEIISGTSIYDILIAKKTA